MAEQPPASQDGLNAMELMIAAIFLRGFQNQEKNLNFGE